jgi:hypothetical protein
MGLSIVPSFSIDLAGETRALRYGFRAFKELGLNPFQPKTIMDFLGSQLGALDVDKAAAYIRAGLLWEYAKGQPRAGETPPTVEEMVDMLDLNLFMRTFNQSIEAAGLQVKDGEDGEESDGAETADPPQA